MNNGKTVNELASDTTSRSAPKRASPQDEAEYLRRQTADAEQALANALRDVRKNLVGTLDVRAWTQHHPLPAVGVAAASGFVTAVLASLVAKHASAEPRSPEPRREECRPPTEGARKKQSWLMALGWAGVDVLKSALVASLKSPPPSSASAGDNGAHAEEASSVR
jgi:ElaB/YqjD/DUF883 family membrane-anchored ribosome-binding protein